MTTFNSEKALAGEKVIDIDGDEVTQLKKYETNNGDWLVGVCKGAIAHYDMAGCRFKVLRLFMAPKQLSGFINEYAIHTPTWHSTREAADMDFKTKEKRLACIDLSQFEEGHGL